MVSSSRRVVLHLEHLKVQTQFVYVVNRPLPQVEPVNGVGGGVLESHRPDVVPRGYEDGVVDARAGSCGGHDTVAVIEVTTAGGGGVVQLLLATTDLTVRVYGNQAVDSGRIGAGGRRGVTRERANASASKRGGSDEKEKNV